MGAETQSRIEQSRLTASGVEAEIVIGNTRHHVSYDVAGAPASEPADTFLIASLLPAMRVGGTLTASEPVSGRLLDALPNVQEMYRSFAQRYAVYDRYQPISIEASTRPPRELSSGRGVAAFFSGGVDSFYTTLRHEHEITALIFVIGFEAGLSDQTLATRVLPAVRGAAAELGKTLIEVRTDVWPFAQHYVHWDGYFGAALASVAQLLSSTFHRVYIPATETYGYLTPLGSHPVLDPLWSTEELSIVHDGCEASRLDKLAFFSTHPVARKHLRVCFDSPNSGYNCGRCEKCLRTMVAMEALGVLDHFETFPAAIDLPAVARVDLPEIRYTWDTSVQLLESRNPALARALRRQLYTARARAVRRITHVWRRIRRLAVRLLEVAEARRTSG